MISSGVMTRVDPPVPAIDGTIAGTGSSAIRRDEAGRYVIGGWSFSSLEQAREYEARHQTRASASATPASRSTREARPAADMSADPAPVEGAVPPAGSVGVDGPVTAEAARRLPVIDGEDAVKGDAAASGGPSAIRRDAAGRYAVAGWSFSTLAQAQEFEGRSARRSATPPTVAVPPRSILPTPAGTSSTTRATGRAPATVPASPVSASVGIALPPAEASAAGRETPRWVSAREALNAGGTAFEADMIYFGTPQRHDPRQDHSRIDPALRVDPRGDPAGTTLGYWPSYGDFDPRARATYLAWLTAGRSDPGIPVGYVLVFLYGLEQRLLIDDARADAGAIFTELRRLMALRPDDYSFQSHAARLLALSALYEEEDGAPPTADCSRNWEPELPLDLRIRLGRRLRDGRPFDADDSLRWVLALPDVHLRTPGQRCFEELRELWCARFGARHPDGLTVRRPKRTVRHEYRAASGKFTANLTVDELPDVSGVSAPLGPLRTLLDGCLDDLSAFSRLVGREPASRQRLQAQMLLPPELRVTAGALRESRDRLDAAVAGAGTGTVTAADLARLLDLEIGPGVDRLSTSTVRQVGAALDALDRGFEPDRRYGSAVGLRPETAVAVFPAAGGGAVDHERAAYSAARTVVEIATLAAAADGEVVQAEMDAITRRLHSLPDLDAVDLDRLMAGCRALAADPPKVRSALKRLAELPAGRRAEVAWSAIDAAVADGMVRPEEVKFLEALHTALGLPASALYSALHRGQEDAGPVLVDAGGPSSEVGIPAEPVAAGVAIDAGRLARIRGETSRVSALLADIFVEEEPQATASAPAVPVDRPPPLGFDGLDSPHADLLRALLAEPLGRAAFDAAAAARRLMPDGAIETINEWGFDRFGEPVLDDEDDIRVSPYVLDQLASLGAAA